MAEKRMFAKTIVLSDAFLDMPLSARCLYFTLGMLADDDGFVDSPKSIMRQAGCSPDDMKLLIQKRFVLAFDSGVLVIKHWRINNYLQKDRYKPTNYIDEFNCLKIEENGSYTEKTPMYTDCIQSVYTDKNRLDKNSIDKNRLDKNNTLPDKQTKFIPPSVEEVRVYCQERNNGINPQTFVDFYSSKGWMVGKNKMKDWKACIRTWEQSRAENAKPKSNASYDINEIEKSFNEGDDL